MAGDIYDFYIGDDELSGMKLFIRVQVDEHFVGPDGRVRVRLKPIGGGRTNVPRWATWPRLTFDAESIESMRRTQQLEPCVSDMVGAPAVT